jgi:hypothetical protein
MNHHWLYIVAFVLFVLAACPTGWRVRCEWLGVAALVLTLIV